VKPKWEQEIDISLGNQNWYRNAWCHLRAWTLKDKEEQEVLGNRF
jgi:hypothetical protein